MHKEPTNTRNGITRNTLQNSLSNVLPDHKYENIQCGLTRLTGSKAYHGTGAQLKRSAYATFMFSVWLLPHHAQEESKHPRVDHVVMHHLFNFFAVSQKFRTVLHVAQGCTSLSKAHPEHFACRFAFRLLGIEIFKRRDNWRHRWKLVALACRPCIHQEWQEFCKRFQSTACGARHCDRLLPLARHGVPHRKACLNPNLVGESCRSAADAFRFKSSIQWANRNNAWTFQHVAEG